MAKKKVENAIFRTLKPSGVHIFTAMKGGLEYFKKGHPQALRTKLHQIEMQAEGTVLVPLDEEVIEVNELTRMGKVRKTVEIMRERIEAGGAGFVEVTQEDLKKAKMASVDSKVLAGAHSKMVKTSKELDALTKPEIYSYVEALLTLGYEVEEILKKKTDKAYTKLMLMEDIIKETIPEAKKEAAPEIAEEEGDTEE